MTDGTWTERQQSGDNGSPGGPGVTPFLVALQEGLREEVALDIVSPQGDSRAMRIHVEQPWLRVSPMELPAGGGRATLQFVPDQLGAMEMASGRLETTLLVEVIPTRALRFGDAAPRLPRTVVPVTVELKAVDVVAPPGVGEHSISPPPEPPIIQPTEFGPPQEVAGPYEEIFVLPSETALGFTNVPSDAVLTKTISFTWMRGRKDVLAITRDASWLQVQPARLDFRSGKLTQDVTVRVIGRDLPAFGSAPGHVFYTTEETSEHIAINAEREDEDAIRARAKRLRIATAWVAAGMYALYLLVLLFRLHFPPTVVGLPALAVGALAGGAYTWQNTRSMHALLWGAAAAVAALVICVTRDTFAARHLALVLVPAAGLPAVWLLAGAGFYRNPSAGYLVPVIPATTALVMAALLTGVLQLSPQAVRDTSGPGERGREMHAAETTAGTSAAPQASVRRTDPAPAGAGAAARGATNSGGGAAPQVAAPAAPVDPVPTSPGALRKYLRTHPSDVVALNRLAELELASGAPERALSLWKKSIACDPGQAGLARKISELENRR